MKHSPPFVADVVRQAYSEGVTDLLCLALAPHYSGMSIGGYAKAVDEGNASIGDSLNVRLVRSWHGRPDFISMWGKRVSEKAREAGPDSALIFSAHSLPERILQEGDPYRDQLLASAFLVAEWAGRKEWSFAFQSASKTGEPWLGPDILEQLERLYGLGRRSFLIAPIGFVSDHLEILYDIDVRCVSWAKQKGVELVRCESPNDSGELIACLASIVNDNGF